MPVLFVDRQIVGHESARALTLTHDAATGKEEVAAAHVARLRPHATRRASRPLRGSLRLNPHPQKS